MMVKTMKAFVMILVVTLAVITFAACGAKEDDGGDVENPTVDSYTVEFKVGGTVIKSVDADKGTPVVTLLPQEPIGEEWEDFVGWNGYTDGMKVTEDVSFAAVFNEVKFSIKFVVDGTTIYDENIRRGTLVSTLLPTNPDKQWFTFAGWQGYCERMKVTKDGTFNAQWADREYTINYHLRVDNAQISTYSQKLTHNANYTLPMPIHEYLVFGGWYSSVGLDGLGMKHEDGAWNTDGDLDLYAYWYGLDDLAYSGTTTLSVAKGSCTLTDIRIPKSYDGRIVTKVSDSGFVDAVDLISITIPSTITEIGLSAFAGCVDLENIYFNAVNCANYPIQDLDYAMFDNAGRDSIGIQVTIGASVTNVPSLLFYGANIISVTFDEGSQCQSIGLGAFYGRKITSIILPNSVKNIGASAFSGCIELTNINIPYGVETIGSSAFTNTGITSLTLPGSVVSIESNVFNGPIVWNYNPLFDSSNVNEHLKFTALVVKLIIPEGVPSVSPYAFYGMVNITKVIIPSSVLTIGSNAFSGCTSLINVTINNGVESISSSAFSGCVGIKELVIPESVTQIGNYAFKGCSNLASITVPNMNQRTDGAVVRFGQMFDGSDTLGNNNIPASLKTVIITGGTSIGYNAFQNCTGLTNIILPESLTKINSNAFSGCIGLTDIVIPSRVKSVGSNAFYGWTSEQTIHIKGRTESESLPSGWSSSWLAECLAMIDWDYQE